MMEWVPLQHPCKKLKNHAEVRGEIQGNIYKSIMVDLPCLLEKTATEYGVTFVELEAWMDKLIAGLLPMSPLPTQKVKTDVTNERKKLKTLLREEKPLKSKPQVCMFHFD